MRSVRRAGGNRKARCGRAFHHALNLQALERRLALAADADPVVEQWSATSFYGTLDDKIADVSGDGRADAIAWNGDSKWVALAQTDKTGFAAPTLWQGAPFYGTRANAIGDVNADGRADLIAWNDSSVWVSPALTSGGFGEPTQWASGLFHGTVCELVADVNADGRVDLVAWNEGAKWVALANPTGNGFGEPRPWGLSNEPFYGGLTNTIGDVNGDGFSDLVAWNADSVFVMAGSAGGFLAPQLGLAGSFYGSRGDGSLAADGQFVADVNGDGRSDLVAWHDSTKWVAFSKGPTFAGGVLIQQDVPFNGNRRNLVGDIDGNGRTDLVALNDTSAWTLRAVTRLSGLVLDRAAADQGVLRGTWSDGTTVTYFGPVGPDGRVSAIESAVVRDPSGQVRTLRFDADGRLGSIESLNGDLVGLTWTSDTSITFRIRAADGLPEVVVPVELPAGPQASRSLAATRALRVDIPPTNSFTVNAASIDCRDVAEAIAAVCAPNEVLGPGGRAVITAALCSAAPEACSLVVRAVATYDFVCSTAGYSPPNTGAPTAVEAMCSFIAAHPAPDQPTPPDPPPEPGQSFLSVDPAAVSGTVGIGLTDAETTFTVTNTSNDPVTLTVTSSSAKVQVSAASQIAAQGSVTVTVRAPWEGFRAAGSETATITVHGLRQNPAGNTDDLSQTVTVPVSLTVLAPQLEVDPSSLTRTVRKGPEAVFEVTVRNTGDPKTQLTFAYADDGSSAMFVPGSARSLTLTGGESTQISIRVPTDAPSWLDGETRTFRPSVRIDSPTLDPTQPEVPIVLSVTLGDVDLRGTYQSTYQKPATKATKVSGTNIETQDIVCDGIIRVVIDRCDVGAGSLIRNISGSVTVTGVDGRTIGPLPFDEAIPLTSPKLVLILERPATGELEDYISTSFTFVRDGDQWILQGDFYFKKKYFPGTDTVVDIVDQASELQYTLR